MVTTEKIFVYNDSNQALSLKGHSENVSFASYAALVSKD
jgi:hypothetical protein